GVVVPLLHENAAEVDEAGGVFRIDPVDVLEGGLRPDEIPLQEKPDAVVIEALAVEGLVGGDGGRERGAQSGGRGGALAPGTTDDRGQLDRHLVLRDDRDREIGYFLELPRDARRVAGEHEAAVVEV